LFLKTRSLNIDDYSFFPPEILFLCFWRVKIVFLFIVEDGRVLIDQLLLKHSGLLKYNFHIIKFTLLRVKFSEF
jgi:hypothetical protein